MTSMVALSPRAALEPGECRSIQSIALEGVPTTWALLERPRPRFDRDAPHRDQEALVRIKAFSCNYRDRAEVFARSIEDRARRLHPIGSDFVGEVVSVGRGVQGLSPGDRVIPDAAYPESMRSVKRPLNVRQGIPTAGASVEFKIFHALQLQPVPDSMADEIAAAFTVGAQTSYSMVRKTEAQPGETALVTAGSSNTSIFIIHALRTLGVRIYAVTSSAHFRDRLLGLGVEGVIVRPRGAGPLVEQPEMKEALRRTRGFDLFFDPFADVFLRSSIDLLRFGGRYVSCGVLSQYQHLTGEEVPQEGLDLRGGFKQVILKSLRILGNCLGSSEDLRAAIRDHVAGRFPVVIDSVFRGTEILPFIARSFGAAPRFGKIVYRFE